MESICLQLSDYGLQQLDDCLPHSDYRLRHPDLVLLNTCVVTQKAEKETRQKIRELRKNYPKSLLVVLGCGVTAKEKFKINLPPADLFIPNHQKERVIELLVQNIYSTKPIEKTFNNKYTLSGRKFIKIQDGCDKYCTFCITCHLRGKPTSIAKEKIIKDINFWVKNGIKEVILTGINIGLWGKDFKIQEPVNNLLEKILSETKIERISFSSIYPEMLTDEFIKLVINNPRFSQYFHLSLQSDSQTVLQRMNRRYNINELTNYLLFIKKIAPSFTFRADIITGFPQESEQEFQETLDFIKKTRISFAHIFSFSPRFGTVAYKMIKSKKWHEISGEIKKKRSEILKSEVKKTRKEEAKKMIGKLSDCLMVRLKDNQWEAISENGWQTRIKPCLPAGRNNELRIKNLKGKIVPIKIIDFKEPYLVGLN